jgi:hypothetical protein
MRPGIAWLSSRAMTSAPGCTRQPPSVRCCAAFSQRRTVETSGVKSGHLMPSPQRYAKRSFVGIARSRRISQTAFKASTQFGVTVASMKLSVTREVADHPEVT